MYFLIAFYTIINIFTYLLMCLDKYRAKKQKFRISENTFFLLALLGAAPGILLAMYFYPWHKTRKTSFLLFSLLGLSLHIFIYWKFFAL